LVNNVKPLRERFLSLTTINDHWAYEWTLCIGDKDIMIKHIQDPYWACMWAIEFGDEEIMKPIAMADDYCKGLWYVTVEGYTEPIHQVTRVLKRQL